MPVTRHFAAPDPGQPAHWRALRTLWAEGTRLEAQALGIEQLLPTPSHPQEWQRADTHWLGVWLQTRLVGAVEHRPDPHQPACWIESLVVAPAHQRQGHGSALVQALLASQPSLVWRVRVSCDNATAMRLYQRLGFVPEDTRGGTGLLHLLTLQRPPST